MNFELLDDQLASAALQDALAFLDAFEHPAPANTIPIAIASAPAPANAFGPVAMSPEELPTTHETTSRLKEPSRNAKVPVQNGNTRSRNRPRGDAKLELERLRHDVKLLEAKLDRLKGASESPHPYRSPGSTSSTSNSSEEESVEAENALTSMWRSVALRQYQRRKHSEMTNRKLKQLMAKQLRLAKALEALYSKRMSQNDLELVYHSRASILHHCEKSPLGCEDSISSLLMNHVQKLSYEIDIHLINSGMTGSEGRILRTIAKPDLFLGTVHETTSSAPLPLSLDAADQILWGGMTMLFKSQSNGPPKSVSMLKDGVDKSFVASVKSPQYSYDMMTRSVTRKFVAKDRIVYAWTSIGTVANKNVRYLGEGLIVLERSPVAPDNSALLKTWHRLHAEQVDSQLIPSASAASELERFKVTGMKTLSQNTAAYFSLLENVLLEAASSKARAKPVPLCVT